MKITLRLDVILLLLIGAILAGHFWARARRIEFAIAAHNQRLAEIEHNERKLQSACRLIAWVPKCIVVAKNAWNFIRKLR